MQIQKISSLQAKAPNFEGCKITKMKRIFRDGIVSPAKYKEADNQEAKAVLEGLQELLQQPIKWVNEHVNRTTSFEVSIGDGIRGGNSRLLLIQEEGDKYRLSHTAYEQGRQVEIDDVDGELSVNNTNLFRKVVGELLVKIHEFPFVGSI